VRCSYISLFIFGFSTMLSAVQAIGFASRKYPPVALQRAGLETALLLKRNVQNARRAEGVDANVLRVQGVAVHKLMGPRVFDCSRIFLIIREGGISSGITHGRTTYAPQLSIALTSCAFFSGGRRGGSGTLRSQASNASEWINAETSWRGSTVRSLFISFKMYGFSILFNALNPL
jgi:hypothetical protein